MQAFISADLTSASCPSPTGCVFYTAQARHPCPSCIAALTSSTDSVDGTAHVQKPLTGTIAEALNTTTPTTFFLDAVGCSASCTSEEPVLLASFDQSCPQLITPLPQSSGIPASVDFSVQSPSLIIRLTVCMLLHC